MATTKKSSGAKSKGSSSSKTAARTSTRSKSTGTAKAKRSMTAKSATASKATPKARSSSPKTKSATKPTKSTTASRSASSTRKASASKGPKSTTAKRGNKTNSKGLISTAIEAVAGLFTDKGTNAIELLKNDHDKVETLFEKVKANEDGNNEPTFKRIKEELDVHAHIEETIFYPHLLDQGDKELKKIVREGVEEHTQVKRLLAELDKLSGDSKTFKEKITVLMENIEHHVKEEEDEMFPMVEDQIPEDMLVRLGSLMQGEKMKVQRMTPARSGKGKASAASGR